MTKRIQPVFDSKQNYVEGIHKKDITLQGVTFRYRLCITHSCQPFHHDLRDVWDVGSSHRRRTCHNTKVQTNLETKKITKHSIYALKNTNTYMNLLPKSYLISY